MTLPDAPNLREYFEERLAHEHDITWHRFSQDEAVRAEYKKEVERRLQELNHAHSQQVAEQQRTLPREMFEQFEKEYRAKHDEIQTWKNQIAGGLTLMRIGGIAGVLALLYGLAHMAGVVK